MNTSNNQTNELSKENIENIFGLTPMQRGMLVQYAKDPDTTAYVEQFDFVLSGPADPHRFEQALNLVIQKYAVLRTIFSYRKTDQPRQVLLKQRYASLAVLDFTQQAGSGSLEDEVETWKNREKAQGFDLSKDQLLRTALITVGDKQHRLIVTFHHIILDGWCLGMVFGDLFLFYEALATQSAADMQNDASLEMSEPHQYASFIKWLGEQDETRGNQYWQTTLADYEAEVGIPWFDYTVSDTPEQPITENLIFELGDSLTQDIEQLAASHEITFNSIFQATWGILLQKFNNTQDAVFGAVVSGRPAQLPGVSNMVGLFINTLPVRVQAQGNTPFINVAKQVHQQLMQSSQFEFMALNDIQKHAALGQKLMNHVVAFENYPIADRLKDMAGSSDPNALSVSDVKVYEQTNYDFNLIVNPSDQTRINFTYNAARFSESQMQQLQRALITLLHNAVAKPSALLHTLSMCSDTERATVLQQYNNTKVDYPDTLTVPALFEQTVAKFADRIALTGEQQSFTYTQLRQKVVSLASLLVAKGVQSADTVAVLLPRCPEMIIATLAVQYAGAAWLPLDIKAPGDRLTFILDNADCNLVVTLRDLSAALPADMARITLESLIDAPDEDRDDLPKPLSPDSPAYIMYTSGSTGQPKGCLVNQQNIVRLVKNSNYAVFDEEQAILSAGSPVFDATTFEYWGALLNGGKLCMYDDSEILDADRLKACLIKEQITTIFLTSALFNQLVDTDITLFAQLKQLLTGGDMASLVHFRKVLETYPNVRIIHCYGPTENTTFSTTYPVVEPSSYRYPIGKPINNSTCYVLDDALNLLPPGAFGELCVGGDGVTQGYIKRPELNETLFLDNPFEPGKRLYRTGDIARWLPDGNLDLQGRKDFQHKIRGFRIELGEVEWNMARIEGVSQAIVMVKDDGNNAKQLHAWFVSDNPATDEKKVRQKLLQQLPAYMVPGYMMRLEKFPLSVSGKVDRNALRELQAKQMINDNIVAPRNDLERSIASIFQQVLGLDQISVFDNFFDVGADSINLITINNRLNKALDKTIETTAMFEHTSIAQLAQYLNPDEVLQKKQQEDEADSLLNARKNLMKSRRLQREMDE